jgi:hypothetical protein
MDMTSVHVNPKSRKVKKGPVPLRRFAMKYSGILKASVDRIFEGISHKAEAIASDARWYNA